MDGLMQGKRGLIMGVANDHSIAWGIAQMLHAHGAEMAFTYQGEAFGRRVRPLADKVGAKLVFAQTTEYMCSATSDGCVQNLNNQAAAVMAAAGIPVVGTWDAMHAKCGDAPTTCGNAFNMTNGLFCPHVR